MNGYLVGFMLLFLALSVVLADVAWHEHDTIKLNAAACEEANAASTKAVTDLKGKLTETQGQLDTINKTHAQTVKDLQIAQQKLIEKQKTRTETITKIIYATPDCTSWADTPVCDNVSDSLQTRFSKAASDKH